MRLIDTNIWVFFGQVGAVDDLLRLPDLAVAESVLVELRRKPKWSELYARVRKAVDAGAYVAVTSTDNLESVDLLGYATREELLKSEPRDFGQCLLNCHMPLGQLHPASGLLDRLGGRRLRRMVE